MQIKSTECKDCKQAKEVMRGRRCLDCYRVYNNALTRAYYARPEQKVRRAENRHKYDTVYYNTDPVANLKQKARCAVGTEIKRGRLVRPLNCSECGKEAKVQAHHNDYTEALEIQWLCHECHLKK